MISRMKLGRGASLILTIVSLRSAQPGAGHGAERQMFRPLHAFLPVIVVCDCDSRADNAGTATYANLLGAGFDDAWLEAAPAPGRPRAPDRGPAQSGGAASTHRREHEKTASGLWPLGHSGVVAVADFGP